MKKAIELLKKVRGEINDTLFVCDHSKHKIGELVVSAKKHIDQVISLLCKQPKSKTESLTVESLKSLERGKIYALQISSLKDIDENLLIEILERTKERFEIEFIVFESGFNLVSIPEGLEVKEKKNE